MAAYTDEIYLYFCEFCFTCKLLKVGFLYLVNTICSFLSICVLFLYFFIHSTIQSQIKNYQDRLAKDISVFSSILTDTDIIRRQRL